MRPLALAVLLTGCSWLDTTEDAEGLDLLAEIPTPEALAEPPAVPAHGWVRTDGPIALLDVAIRAEELPGSDAGGPDAICHSPHHRHREARLVDMPLGDGERTVAIPTSRCVALPYCRWAEARALAASDEARPSLLSSLRGCPGTVVDELLEEADLEVRAQHRLERDIGAPARLHPDELPVVVRLLHAFDEPRLTYLLVDAWERLDRPQIQAQLLRLHQTETDPELERRMGRALGVFADARARAAWSASCVGVKGLLCSSTQQLLPVDETSTHIVRNALQDLPRHASRLYLGDVRAALGEPTSEELLVAVAGDESATTWARTLALQELAALYPERLPEAMQSVRTDARLRVPHLARRARLSEVDDPAAHLASLGLLDPERAVTIDPGADPVAVLFHEGLAVSHHHSLGTPLLGALLSLLDIPEAEVSIDEEAGRITAWVQGSRIDGQYGELHSDTDPSGARIAVAFVNAVAEHVGVDKRALAQPLHGFADGTAPAVVVAPVDALEAGIEDGVLTPVVAEPTAWESRRRLWWTPPETVE